MPDCPSDADLAGFLNDGLPPERLTHVSGHVDGCPLCQARLDKLTHDTDGAVARYKELSSVIPARSGAIPSSPEARTLIVGVNPLPPAAARATPLPQVPGFDVLAEIGRGGMGVVYKARHRRLNRLVALKMILAGGAADARTVQRFLFEAEVMARVQHPQVVQVFEVGTYQGPSGVPIPYLAMELVEGGSLSHRVKQTPLPARTAAELMEGIARAVHAAHAQGIIHRDLKPGNILFPDDRSQRTEVREANAGSASSLTSDLCPLTASAPKVTDFGLAKFTESGSEFTGSGQVVGTPHYMAPEQAAGAKQIGPPADVYALGAILFECLTGRPPFEGEEPISVLLKVVGENPPDVLTLRPDLPRDLAAVVGRCLAKELHRRYGSAQDLADDLRRFLENRPTVARPLRRRERLWLWAKRNPAVAGLALTLAVVLFVAFVMVTWLWWRAEQTAFDERVAKELARASENRALEEAENVQRQKLIADRRQADLEFSRAMTSCEEGRVEEGVPLFLRALELAEATGATDLARAARINLAAWHFELPAPRRVLPHTHQPLLPVFHPDGRRLVVAGRERQLCLWDVQTRQKIHDFAPASRVFPTVLLGVKLGAVYWTAAISPDGKTVVAGGGDGQITVWDIEKPGYRVSFLGTSREGDDIWSVGFAPDGTLWATDGRSGVKRWDLTTLPRPTLLQHLKPPADPQLGHVTVNIMTLSPDGRRVYTGDRAGVVREWDTGDPTRFRSWTLKGWVQDFALSPDGSRLAATGPVGLVQSIDLKTGDFGPEISLSGAYGNGVAFAPKRPYLVTSDGDGNVRFWHRDTGQPVGVPMRFSGSVTRIRFCPDSDEFAVPAGDSVSVCRLPDPTGDLLSPGHGYRIRGMDFSPDGNQLAVTDDTAFEVFDLRGQRRIQLAPDPGPLPLAVRFDPDPSRAQVFRGIRDGFDRLAVPGGSKARPSRAVRLGRVHRLEFVGGSLIALGESVVGRYDPVTTEQLAVGRPANDIPTGTDLSVLAVHPGNRELLVGFGNRVAFLHPESLEPIRAGWRTGDDILDAKYTRDGKEVLVGRRDNQAERLDAGTGARLGRPMPHTRAVTAVAVSPDGKTFLTGSRDGTARFWDAPSGLPLGPSLRHLGPVTHALFAPRGDHIATGTGTGHVMIWDTPPQPAAGSLDELRSRFARPGG